MNETITVTVFIVVIIISAVFSLGLFIGGIIMALDIERMGKKR